MKAESGKDVGEKELGYSFHVDILVTRAINYPLCKAMVYHDHDCIKTMGIQQAHDKIH